MFQPGLLWGVLAVGAIAMGWAAPATAATGDHQLTGPYTHDNLAIYLIHREAGEAGPVPLTLGEAMGQGMVKVIETSEVEELLIRNLGDREVFIQAGDIVKGGKQDRVITTSMIVPPNSGDIPVGAFCVEQNRWSGRGQESVAEFSASTARLPWKAARIALAKRVRQGIVPNADHAASQPGQRQRSVGEGLQERVWDSVRQVQAALGEAMAASVTDARSRSSLQLSLENKALASALEAYEVALGGLLRGHPDAVGYVFAVNGRINSGDEFGSAGLFRKLWPRQLKAAATEAIAQDDPMVREHPALAKVAAFIEEVRAARPAGTSMSGSMRLETRETERALYTGVRRLNGPWIHSTFIAH